jgi:hypothetical protein
MKQPLLVAMATVAAAVLVGAAAAAPTHTVKRYTEVATSSAVQATFSYSYNPKTFVFADVRLQITRSSHVLLNGIIHPPPRESYARVWPANFLPRRSTKSVFVQDLDLDGEPEVFLALYWGGAHCCYFTYLYRYVDGRYRRVYHLWGDPAYKLRDLNSDGEPEFVSGDDRFAYAFTDFADSFWPVRIWQYGAGRFADVTRRFPVQVRADARRVWRWYPKALKQHRSTYGVLAAWTADECLIHRCAGAFRRLEALRRAGKLRGGPPDGTPKTFVRHLHLFLGRTGYA